MIARLPFDHTVARYSEWNRSWSRSSTNGPCRFSRSGSARSGAGFAAAPGVGVGPAVFGGASLSFTSEAGLVILHPVTKPPSNLVLPELEVDELPLAAFGTEAVIGRDIRASCVLVSNGSTNTATLAS